ncbi:MAG: segregation/condensation protein A [Planctomycetota bacterium]
MNEYRVALEVYNGPLDLLLFLIRREEVDIYDIPIARITEQYVAYVGLLQEVDPELIGEFLVLAATLMEIKSRTLLPHPPEEEGDDDVGDPRLELVRQLLEYKKYKDAAYALDAAAELRSERHARSPALPQGDPSEMRLESLDIWNLFEAFNGLLKQIGKSGAVHRVSVDDTPIALHAADVVDALTRANGTMRFEEVFRGRTRAEMIGLFLALLELIRQRRVRAVQDRPFGPIELVLLDAAPLDEVRDDYAGGAESAGEGAGEAEAALEAGRGADPTPADDDFGDLDAEAADVSDDDDAMAWGALENLDRLGDREKEEEHEPQ